MITCLDAGILPYEEALKLQLKLRERRIRGEIEDHLIFLEHPPIYTMGRRDSEADLLVSKEWLDQHGMAIHKTDRGGRMTYHGPGQIVGYLIFRLKGAIPELVWKIEETIIRTLLNFQLKGTRDAKYPGVWIGTKKVAAVGLRIEKGVTMHGFSLNVNCDLSPYEWINPCGIADRGVTSMEKEIGWRPALRDIKDDLLKNLAAIFEDRVSVAGMSLHHPE